MSQRIEVSKSVFQKWKTLVELAAETGFSHTALLNALKRFGYERKLVDHANKELGRRPYAYRVKQ